MRQHRCSIIPLILVFVIIVCLFTCGCEDNEDGLRLEPGGEHVIHIDAREGDILVLEWRADGEIGWQLSDDNDTAVPGRTELIFGYEIEGREEILLYQNATYRIRFENLAREEIYLTMSWEIR